MRIHPPKDIVLSVLNGRRLERSSPEQEYPYAERVKAVAVVGHRATGAAYRFDGARLYCCEDGNWLYRAWPEDIGGKPLTFGGMGGGEKAPLYA